MGGINSGRRGRRFTIDDCLIIDLPLLMKFGLIRHGQVGTGSLTWRQGREPVGSIRYEYNLANPLRAELKLSFDWALIGQESRRIEQRILLTLTRPNFGGVRWWLQCPVTGQRATKLFKPPGQEIFASRGVWGLGYRSQRVPAYLRQLEQLQKIHDKLGQNAHWAMPPRRPKGMWRRTYQRHLARCRPLDRQLRVEWNRVQTLIANDPL